jgi:hypothetical protein
LLQKWSKETLKLISGEKVFHGHSVSPSYYLSKVYACVKRTKDLCEMYVVIIWIIEIQSSFQHKKDSKIKSKTVTNVNKSTLKLVIMDICLSYRI